MVSIPPALFCRPVSYSGKIYRMEYLFYTSFFFIYCIGTPLPTFEDYEIITSEDRQKYLRIFQGSDPTDGLINGDKAMKILMRSKLPVSLLSQIW